MLDHVERRRAAKQPAGKHFVPSQLFLDRRALFHEQLHERPGLGRILPWRGALAGGELDDGVADAARFAAAQLHHLRDVVALVEEPERGHAVLDRRAIGAFDNPARRGGRAAAALRRLGRRGRFSLLVAAAAAERRQNQQ
jgi:hypothetical protein